MVTCAAARDCVVPTDQANVLFNIITLNPAIVTSPADSSETAAPTTFSSAERQVSNISDFGS